MFVQILQIEILILISMIVLFQHLIPKTWNKNQVNQSKRKKK